MTTSTTAYRPCACGTCCETTIGAPDELCSDCEEAGCEVDGDCQLVLAEDDDLGGSPAARVDGQGAVVIAAPKKASPYHRAVELTETLGEVAPIIDAAVADLRDLGKKNHADVLRRAALLLDEVLCVLRAEQIVIDPATGEPVSKGGR